MDKLEESLETLLKLDEAIETLHKVCEDNCCGDECPLYKLCQYLWNGNCFDYMSSAIEDVFGDGEW